jgi:hypothetical protein
MAPDVYEVNNLFRFIFQVYQEQIALDMALAMADKLSGKRMVSMDNGYGLARCQDVYYIN